MKTLSSMPQITRIPRITRITRIFTWLTYNLGIQPRSEYHTSLVIKSSLHWLIPLSFLFVFVQWSVLAALKLSAGDVIVSQKGFNGEGKSNSTSNCPNLDTLCSRVPSTTKEFEIRKPENPIIQKFSKTLVVGSNTGPQKIKNRASLLYPLRYRS